jgi:hypothetical protein
MAKLESVGFVGVTSVPPPAPSRNDGMRNDGAHALVDANLERPAKVNADGMELVQGKGDNTIKL